MRSTRLLGFLVAAVLIAVAGIGSAQAATPSARPVAPHAHHIPRGAVSLPAKDIQHFSHLLHSKRPGGGKTANQTSTNWAGYAANNGTFTTVTSSWTEPDVSCDSDGIVAFWIGLDGWGSDSVEQDGTGVDCSSGYAQQFAWWETYPANSIQEYGDPVSAGDSLTSTVTDVGGGQYEMVLTDNSQGWTEDQTVGASGSDASAEVIAEAVTSGSSVTPLPDFSSVTFTGSTFNNTELSSAGGQAIDMTDGSGNVIASTGPDDGNGDFTVTYGG
jgi:Peptidase A4 family